MNSIIFFFKKHAVVLLFILLQIISITVFVTYNRFPNIVFGEWIFYTNVKIQTEVKDISNYLYLKEINEKLIEENTNLRNQLDYNYITYQKQGNNKVIANISSFSTEKSKDSSIVFFQQYQWLKTDVVDFLRKQNNIFLILRGGKNDHIEENMVLISTQGVAGNIIKVYSDYSVAITLFNEKTKIIGKLLGNSTLCALEWNALEPNILICKNFPINSNAKIGDTITTSIYSVKYPPNLPIGTIQEVNENKQTRELSLKIKPFVDYNNLYQTYIIKNKDYHTLEDIKSDINKE